MSRNWTAKNQWRTSARDMTIKDQVCEKSVVLPGYSGFVPGYNANALPGRN